MYLLLLTILVMYDSPLHIISKLSHKIVAILIMLLTLPLLVIIHPFPFISLSPFLLVYPHSIPCIVQKLSLILVSTYVIVKSEITP